MVSADKVTKVVAMVRKAEVEVMVHKVVTEEVHTVAHKVVTVVEVLTVDHRKNMVADHKEVMEVAHKVATEVAEVRTGHRETMGHHKVVMADQADMVLPVEVVMDLNRITEAAEVAMADTDKVHNAELREITEEVRSLADHKTATVNTVAPVEVQKADMAVRTEEDKKAKAVMVLRADVADIKVAEVETPII